MQGYIQGSNPKPRKMWIFWGRTKSFTIWNFVNSNSKSVIPELLLGFFGIRAHVFLFMLSEFVMILLFALLLWTLTLKVPPGYPRVPPGYFKKILSIAWNSSFQILIFYFSHLIRSPKFAVNYEQKRFLDYYLIIIGTLVQTIFSTVYDTVYFFTDIGTLGSNFVEKSGNYC